MTFGLVGMKLPSLGGMVDAISMRISREALHKKFTHEAVVFLRTCLHWVMQSKFKSVACLNAGFMKHFTRIILFDSSSWDVHPGLSEMFPGSGGAASKANCKVQAGYDFKSGHFVTLDITPGIRPDSQYTHEVAKHCAPGDLVIMDLGYSCLQTFVELVTLGAFFLSRLSLSLTILDEHRQKIDLVKRCAKLKDNLAEFSVIIGADPLKQVACSLICLRVSDEVAQRRRRKLLKEAKKKGRTPSEKHLQLAAWTFMITNVNAAVLPMQMVRTLYALRWQIELLFKQFKSILTIHQTPVKSNHHRLQCEILGKLIVAVLISRLHADMNVFAWNNAHREVSFDKFYKRMQERAFFILKMLLISPAALVIYLREELPTLFKNCLKGQQNKRKSTLEQLMALDQLTMECDYMAA